MGRRAPHRPRRVLGAARPAAAAGALPRGRRRSRVVPRCSTRRFGGPGANGLLDLAGLRGEALATLLYVNNWHLIYAHQSYFAQFSTPSPLQHTWSLAIEEQFYLVWPPVLLLLLHVARRSWRRAGVGLTVALGLASTIAMAVLFHPGVDPSRVYYGTDTRLFDLMAGAAVAFVAASRPQPGPAARRTLHVAGPAGGAPRSPCSG